MSVVQGHRFVEHPDNMQYLCKYFEYRYFLKNISQVSPRPRRHLGKECPVRKDLELCGGTTSETQSRAAGIKEIQFKCC